MLKRNLSTYRFEAYPKSSPKYWYRIYAHFYVRKMEKSSNFLVLSLVRLAMMLQRTESLCHNRFIEIFSLPSSLVLLYHISIPSFQKKTTQNFAQRWGFCLAKFSKAFLARKKFEFLSWVWTMQERPQFYIGYKMKVTRQFKLFQRLVSM